MYIKTIKHTTGTVDYTVYTKEEADAAGIEYKPWREALPGEYLITDDDVVAKVIKRREYTEYGLMHRVSVFITSPVGSVIWRKRYNAKKFYSGSLSNIHAASGKAYQYESMKDKKNALMARWYAMSNDLPFAIQMSYGDVKPNKAKTLRVLAKTEAFKSMVTNEMKQLLEDNHFAKNDVLALISEALVMAKEKGNVNGFIRVVENLIDLNQMKTPDKVVDTLRLSASTTETLDDVIRREEASLVATVSSNDIEDGSYEDAETEE